MMYGGFVPPPAVQRDQVIITRLVADCLEEVAPFARANQLARVLVSRGAGPESVVAVMIDRSVELVVTVLAVLKSGAAYVPIDPALPDRRIALMASEAEICQRRRGMVAPG